MKAVIKKILKSNYHLYEFAIYINDKICNHNKCNIINNGLIKTTKHIRGRNNLIIIGQNSILERTSIRINGNNNSITIGNNCRIGPNCSFLVEGNNIKIVIGNNCTFTRLIHFCAQENNMEIIIKNDCMFSNNIIIRTSDSHPIYDMETGVRINLPKSISIGNHVWIAPNSTIMKGVTIYDNSIIASNSLVTHDVSSNSLAAGIPAKVIKNNIRWTRENLF